MVGHNSDHNIALEKSIASDSHVFFSKKIARVVRAFSFILCMSMLVISFSGINENLLATVSPNATVNASSINVRSSPRSDIATNIVDRITNGQRVQVGQTMASQGTDTYVWCSISYEKGGVEKTGYVAYCYVSLDPSSGDAAFEASIANFPESYKSALRSLHVKYPNWTFVPLMVGADWNSVVGAESTLGRSLIINTVNDAWKSTASGAYDPITDTYIAYDGNSWVNAAPEVVAYYLDPRNCLSERSVFQFLNLSYDSTKQTVDSISTMLNSTFMAGAVITDPSGNSYTYAQSFVNAATSFGVSPNFLVARVVQEIGASGSRSSSGTVPEYPGIYNYYNIGASSSGDPVLTGLAYASRIDANYFLPWTSPYLSIIGGAKWISDKYIATGQNTLYLQKFDVTDNGNGLYWHQYMTNIQAMTNESSTLYNSYANTGMLSSSLSFYIPVYDNMPASTSLPSESGNTNNYLSSLSVNGFSLTPTFDTNTTYYDVIVPYQTSVMNLAAIPVSSDSLVSGTGDVSLGVGDNTFSISVTAQNGSVKTYTVHVVRQEQAGADLFETTLKINADLSMTGMSPGMLFSDISAKITLKNGGTTQFLHSDGTVISDLSQKVSTGDRILILDASGAIGYSYTLVIMGDTNGDGNISASDLTLLSRHVLRTSSLAGAYLSASDVNHDGNISASDLTLISRHVLRTYSIIQ